jgi:hypothetical protein
MRRLPTRSLNRSELFSDGECRLSESIGNDIWVGSDALYGSDGNVGSELSVDEAGSLVGSERFRDGSET